MTSLKVGVGALLPLLLSLLLLAVSKAHAEVQEHQISDDGNVHIPLQFSFPYYGRTFTDSWMFSNGVVGFLSPQTSFCCTGQDLSNPNNHNPIWNFALMPLWTDLRNYNGRFLTEGTEEYQRYVWENISEYGRSGSENTFGVEIFPSGDWRFYHEKIDINRAFTIGATGDLSKGEYQQFEYYPQGLQDYNYGYQWNSTNPWTPTYNGDPNPINICDADPLADPSCPGYADAYHQQQCSFDPLYDPTCSGYEQAYLDLQCSYDPLYDTTCSGYAEAYFSQQCGLDPLYDTQCPGYAEAIVATYVTPNETTTDSSQTISSTSEATVPITDPEEIAMPSTTGDPTVDSVLKDLADVSITTVVMEDSATQTIEVVQETQETERETETSTETDSAGEMEELVAEVEDGDRSETKSVSESSGDVEEQDSEGESNGESESSESDRSESGKDAKSKDSKREKIKKAVAKKATQLAESMSQAASLEAQQAVQAQVLALINYVPDFNTYQRQMNGGYLPDAVGYADTQVPESRRGLRNGLAQQLLHEKMVEMQYENISSQ